MATVFKNSHLLTLSALVFCTASQLVGTPSARAQGAQTKTNLTYPGAPSAPPAAATELIQAKPTAPGTNPVSNPAANTNQASQNAVQAAAQPSAPPAGQPAGQPANLLNLGNLLPAQTPGAIAAPTLSFVDINSGRFGKLEIDLVDGQFMEGAADNLHLVARNMDLNKGELKSLDIDGKGVHLQDFIVDKMSISTQGALTFDTGLFINQKMLQFTSPAQAQVSAVISQESLNKFLKAPTTLERLSVTASRKGGFLASLIGNGGLKIAQAGIVLGKNNAVNINADGQLAMGQLAMPLSAEIESVLEIKDGWVQLGDTKLKTAGQEISPQLSEMFVKKINNLSNMGHKSDDIHFAFTDLKVTAGKGLVVNGTAQINRLRFGRAN